LNRWTRDGLPESSKSTAAITVPAKLLVKVAALTMTGSPATAAVADRRFARLEDEVRRQQREIGALRRALRSGR
jgi:hypothetical protein